jgi:hypothetical protein
LNIKRSKEEVWYWYEMMETYQKSGLIQTAFCKENNLDYKVFCNMRFRIIYKRDTEPKLYQKLMSIGREYMSLGYAKGSAEFAKKHGVNPRHLSEVATHIGYLDIIEEIKAEREPEQMKFVQVQHQGNLRAPVQEAEVVEKQNDLEIIIAKGVKVSISPNIDTMKVIKIIELLKDL